MLWNSIERGLAVTIDRKVKLLTFGMGKSDEESRRKKFVSSTTITV